MPQSRASGGRRPAGNKSGDGSRRDDGPRPARKKTTSRGRPGAKKTGSRTGNKSSSGGSTWSRSTDKDAPRHRSGKGRGDPRKTGARSPNSRRSDDRRRDRPPRDDEKRRVEELGPPPKFDGPLPEAFEVLGIEAHLLRAIAQAGYDTPTPIQEKAIPVILKGRDLLAGAQTGTGKTAAFAIPILQGLFPPGRKANTRIPKSPRALILAPTRELAAQVEDAFQKYGRHTGVRCAAVFGGVSIDRQIKASARGLDVVVATPGRLIDLLNQGFIQLNRVQMLTLDEADRMLDMGFMPAIRKILEELPPRRQNLLFSATLPKEICKLAERFMNDPVSIQVAPSNTIAAKVRHKMHPVRHTDKRHVLEKILRDEDQQTLVFCKTKHGSDRLTRLLVRSGLTALAIHGNKSQNARTNALDSFKRGKTKILVATDIAARGLDIRDLPMVINYDLPMVAEDYIHRIGRTGRAGGEGQAISLVSDREKDLLKDIQKLLGEPIERIPVPGFATGEDPSTAAPAKSGPRRPPRNRKDGTPRRAAAGRPRSPSDDRRPARDSDRSSSEGERRPSSGGDSRPRSSGSRPPKTRRDSSSRPPREGGERSSGSGDEATRRKRSPPRQRVRR